MVLVQRSPLMQLRRGASASAVAPTAGMMPSKQSDGGTAHRAHSLNIGYGDGRISPPVVASDESPTPSQRQTTPIVWMNQALEWTAPIANPPQASCALTTASTSKSAATLRAPLLRKTRSWTRSSRSVAGNHLDRFVKLVYVAAVVSWMVAKAFTRGPEYFQVMSQELENKQWAADVYIKHVTADLEQAQQLFVEEKQLVRTLKQTKHALQHEVRVLSELQTVGKVYRHSPYIAKGAAGESMAHQWLEYRLSGLKTKKNDLKGYLQAASRRIVTSRFGPGPHRVKFTIDHIDPTDTAPSKVRKSFVVQLASLDWTPASVHFFLDMVSSKVWDNTAFLHHETTEHIIAAAPIDYHSQRIKHHELSALGWSGVGFPEYSPEFPHKKYTLGFAGQGPTFYINTVDNSVHHGPGGQGHHHLLPEDADPCFGVVIEGQDVVDEMIKFGMLQTTKISSSKNATHSPANDDHTWTHLVSVEIV